MNVQGRFRNDWEPVILAEHVVAEGSWTYQGRTTYSVRLLQRTFNYTAADIEAIEHAVCDSINADYIDYAISDEGSIFLWEFTDESGNTTSPHFSSLEAARHHFSSYEGQSSIRWYVADN